MLVYQRVPSRIYNDIHLFPGYIIPANLYNIVFLMVNLCLFCREWLLNVMNIYEAIFMG